MESGGVRGVRGFAGCMYEAKKAKEAKEAEEEPRKPRKANGKQMKPNPREATTDKPGALKCLLKVF